VLLNALVSAVCGKKPEEKKTAPMATPSTAMQAEARTV